MPHFSSSHALLPFPPNHIDAASGGTGTGTPLDTHSPSIADDLKSLVKEEYEDHGPNPEPTPHPSSDGDFSESWLRRGVNLVIGTPGRVKCEPPQDVEAYIHRSGRSGSAGNSGVAVMLYDPRKANVSKIEKESGVEFEHITAPQPSYLAKSAGLGTIKSVYSVISAF